MIRAVFPASFDPIHNGHIDIANRAVKLFDELIIAVYKRPSKNLLFNAEERIALVEQAFAGVKKVRVVPFDNLTVQFCREMDAQVIVRGLRVFSDFEYEFRLALANSQLAPEIETVALITSKEHTFLSSTTVREIASLDGDVGGMVPPYVKEALKNKFAENSEI